MQVKNDSSVILRTVELTKHFGGLVAVESVNLDFPREGVTGIIGPNGAGKTTLFNLITGYLEPTRGSVFFDEGKISGLRPHEIVNRGMVRTFQVPQCCRDLTVRENIRLACLRRYEGKAIEEKITEFAALSSLESRLETHTGNLTIGDLRRVEIAMAGATRPRIILLDEPFSGLTDIECEETSTLIKKLSKTATLVLIDHKLKHLMPLVDDVVVLNHGQVFFRGSASAVSANPDVQRIYIGGEIV
jgi:ABC-type branched-subunit amino acid transport system ATPase component